MNAIDAAFDSVEQTTTTAEFPLSPATGGYHVIGNQKALEDRLVLSMVNDQLPDEDEVDSMSEITKGFNKNKYDFGSLDEAAADALTTVQDATGLRVPTAGLWGAIAVMKSEWGANHRHQVSQQGHHGVGLTKEGEVRDGSYGDVFPYAPAFNDVGGWRHLDGDEAEALRERDIPVDDLDCAGTKLKVLEGVPVAVADREALKDAVATLEEFPTELSGPDGYDGDGEFTEDDSTPSSMSEPTEEYTVVEDGFDPTVLTVDEIKEEVTNVDSLPALREMLELEKDDADRKWAKKRIQQRINSDDVDGDDNGSSRYATENTEAGGNALDDVDTDDGGSDGTESSVDELMTLYDLSEIEAGAVKQRTDDTGEFGDYREAVNEMGLN